MKVMFDTHRRFIELLGEQAVHFAAAAEATHGEGGRDLAGFVRAHDAARAVQVSLDEVMEETELFWPRERYGRPDVRKASRTLMDAMVDWVVSIHHEVDLLDLHDLDVPEELGIKREKSRVGVDADADSLLLLGNVAAMFAWCEIQHGILRMVVDDARQREVRLGEFATCHEWFEEEHAALAEWVKAGHIAEDAVVAASAKYLAVTAEAMRSDVVNISEQYGTVGA